ncbi:MAG: right-handed parallel beta-helix repeat-containing protein [Verrucomicrobiota bacterium]
MKPIHKFTRSGGLALGSKFVIISSMTFKWFKDRTLLGIAAVLLSIWPAVGNGAASISVEKFGVAGDGVADDGPAVRRALQAAIAAGPGTKLVFPKRTYRLGRREDSDFQFALKGIVGLTIDGNGSSLVLDPHNGIFSLAKCRDVTIGGFEIDFNPLPFTQGTIVDVLPKSRSFDLRIEPGYPLPPSDAVVKQRLGKEGWDWGSVIDPIERHLRWDVSAHFFIESVNPVPGKERVYRIQVTQGYAKQLIPVRPKDRFFLPLRVDAAGVRSVGHNIMVTESSDCTIERITLHAARNGMDFAILRNEGRITLRQNRITFKPGTTRLGSTWKDGMHCKNNRVGPLIEDCWFEGMLDDSINLSADTAMAARVVSNTEFQLVGPDFKAGDAVMVFDPRSNQILAQTRVVRINRDANRTTVVLADPIPQVIPGRKQPHSDIASTHFYNMDYVNSGFIVRNCTFKPQRRHAILTRGSNGLIEGNLIEGIGGSGISMGNEIGSFYEGPFPHDNIIRTNTIRNTQMAAIEIYSRGLTRQGQNARDIEVLGNQITVLPGKPGIVVESAANVAVMGNSITSAEGKSLKEARLTVKNSKDVRVEW